MPRKKGKPTWKPAAMLDVVDKKKGFRMRWASNDPLNLQRKKAEGWVMANKETGIDAEHEHPEKTGDGHSMTSVTEYRDLVLMALPEELGKARDEYIEERTELQTMNLKRNLEDDLKNKKGKSADTYGKIVIE
jgi:hypothetical protein